MFTYRYQVTQECGDHVVKVAQIPKNETEKYLKTKAESYSLYTR